MQQIFPRRTTFTISKSLFGLLKLWNNTDITRAYKFDTDEECRLCRLFVVMDKNLMLWKMSGKDVIQYDAKHRTDKYNMPLGCFVTVDDEGNTQMLAASVIKHEDKDSFQWIFTKFLECFGKAPKVIISDGDTSMAEALTLTCKDTSHLLCTWHLHKNFNERIYPLYSNDYDSWRRLSNEWWKLCKKKAMLEVKTCFKKNGMIWLGQFNAIKIIN